MAVLFNPVAQAKFVHTVVGRLCHRRDLRAVGMSAWFLLQGRHRRTRQALDGRRRQLRPGLGPLGGGAGRRERLRRHRTSEDEARRDRGMWETEPAPAGLTRLRHPRPRTRETAYRSADPLGARPDHHPLAYRPRCQASCRSVEHAENRIANGIKAYDALQTASGPMRHDAASPPDSSTIRGETSATRCC